MKSRESCDRSNSSKTLIDIKIGGYFSNKVRYVMAACNNRGQWSETPVLPSCPVFSWILCSTICVICTVAGEPSKDYVLWAV